MKHLNDLEDELIRNARMRRHAKLAIQLLEDALKAQTSGKSYVVVDHIERAITLLRKDDNE